MGTGIPLLNEYKQEFFWKRFPQTVLGGPKLRLGYDAPVYVYLLQALLFIIPFLIGGIFTLLVELDAILDYIAVIVYGSIMFVFVLVSQCTTTVIHAKESSEFPYPTKKQQLLAEEDEIDFFSCCGIETVGFVIPKKKFKINILIHAIIAGPMCGLTLWYLLPVTLNNLYYNNIGATIVLFCFGWFTLCIAQYPLTVAAPPESAAYRTLDRWELSPLMRPFYVYLCITFDLLYRYASTGFLTANQALHIVFACLPLIWTCGLLPPLDALLFWLLEQVHVFLLGGSPLASEVRVFVIVTLSIGVYLAAYFIPASLGTVIICALMGYILSLDLGGLGSQLNFLLRTRNKVSNDEQGTVSIGKPTGFLWKWGLLEFLYHFVMLAFVGVLSGILNYNSNSFSSEAWKGLGYTIIGLCVVEKILRDIQNVYIILGLWRNMLFPSSSRSTRTFRNRKRQLQAIGFIKRIFANWVSPLIMLSYLSILITSTNPTSTAATAHLNTYTAVWYTFGIVRAFRWIWQGTVNSLLELSVTHIILVTLSTNTIVIEYGVPILSLLIGLCRDRCFQFLNKLYFFVTVLISSWMDKKQRRGSTAVTILLSIIFFPVIVGILAAASAISAPLLPIFTLPLFFIAFPRPTKFWPEPVGASANVNADTMFYKQLAPKLSQSLRTGFANGSLGEPNPGNHYLVRFEDRMLWIMVLERGNGYCTVNIKGLELQETSCHTAEAARIDDVLEVAFEIADENKPCLGRWNQYPLHTLTPLDVAEILAYSDARNVLTGIIDNNDAKPAVKGFFIKSLIWVILHHVNKLKIKEKEKNKKGFGGKNEKVIKNKEKVELEEINHNKETSVSNNIGNKSKNMPIDAVVVEVPKKAHEDMFVPKQNRPPSGRSAKRKSSWTSSINSFTDSIFSDDGLFDTKPKNNKHITKKDDFSRKNLSPVMFGEPVKSKSKHFGDDIDDLIEDLDFGVPAMDISKPKQTFNNKMPVKKQTFGNSIYKPVTNLAGSPDFKCPYSAHISLPPRWRELPLEYSQISRLLGQFPKDWYKFVLETLDWSLTGQSGQKVSSEVASDDTLMNCYAQLIMACYSIFESEGDSLNSANYLYNCYIGNIPWNLMLDWLSEDKELHNLVVKAYRYGFKMMVDQMLFGEMQGHVELQECLEEYDRDWYIGLEKDEEWKTAVLESKPNLFSLGHNKQQGIYSSRLLSLQETMVHIGRLNSEAVRGQWANLNLELIYFTNDDEERYSIQAHPVILRNLTVQAADPPLGYPIFSSQPISIPTI